MTTDTALIEKREELKRRLAAGEYKTLVDVFLEWFDNLIRKIIRRSEPLLTWLITAILSLTVSLINLGAIYVAGDWASLSVVEFYRIGYRLGFLLLISSVLLLIATPIVLNQSIRRIFILWRDDILDATESIRSLQEFEDWLEKACNLRLHFLVTIFGGLLLGLSSMALYGTLLGAFVGYGFTFDLIIVNLFTAAFVYQFSMVILLPTILRRYDLRLFAADPATSELLSRLSGELAFFVYFVAVYSALFTLASVSQGTSQAAGIFLVLFLWLPIIAVFILNQTSLSSIVRRAKWKTLNEIQTKAEKLQSAENFEDKETMEAINRLMDYHDRVKATRDSALDLRTYLSLFKSLLLPLLALILGNLDLVLKLFGIRP